MDYVALKLEFCLRVCKEWVMWPTFIYFILYFFQERLEEYKRLHTIGKVMGVESHVLSPEETKQLYPLMNVDDIYGTLYSPK